MSIYIQDFEAYDMIIISVLAVVSIHLIEDMFSSFTLMKPYLLLESTLKIGTMVALHKKFDIEKLLFVAFGVC